MNYEDVLFLICTHQTAIEYLLFVRNIPAVTADNFQDIWAGFRYVNFRIQHRRSGIMA